MRAGFIEVHGRQIPVLSGKRIQRHRWYQGSSQSALYHLDEGVQTGGAKSVAATVLTQAAGFQCMFHAHTCEEECTVVKIFETTNNKGVVTKGARFANVGMRATVMLQLAQSTPVETYDDFAFLGRFTLRTEGKTVAIGKITKLPPKKEE